MDDKTKLYYSGDNSRKFWKRINKLKGIEHDVFYSLGVILQNLEQDVLHKLYLCEQRKKEGKLKGIERRKNE